MSLHFDSGNGGVDHSKLPYDPEVKESPSLEAHPTAANISRTGWKRFLGSGEEGYQTSRSMRSRHLMMIAIGGTIGTGIFLSAGSSIALAGPGSALLSYMSVGIFVYAVVISL